MAHSSKQEYIVIKGARQHNLKNIDVAIPINHLVVITGLSGSGKSTLAFDTLYAEGQRRYVESLSTYARQFLGVMQKPEVESIKGLSPAISIEQKTTHANPRSTVGTITEIYDFFRLLFTHVGTPYCPQCGKAIHAQGPESIIQFLMKEPIGTRIQILAPVVRGKKGTYETLFQELNKKGYSKARIDGKMHDLMETGALRLKRYVPHTIEVVIDRQVITSQAKRRLTEGIETALKEADGLALLMIETTNTSTEDTQWREILFSQHLACVDCGLSFDALLPRMFSFNSPFGACEQCHGLGVDYEFDPNLVIPDKSLSLLEGAIHPWRKQMRGWRGQTLQTLAATYNFSLSTPVEKLEKKIIDTLLVGSDRVMKFQYNAKTTDGYWEYSNYFEGVMTQLKRHYKETESEDRRRELEQYMTTAPCLACQGRRLRPISLSIRIGHYNIIELCDLSIARATEFFSSEITKLLEPQQQKIAQSIIKEIHSRLSFLVNVGLDYLTLNREAGSLSGGEAQRIRLATQIGSELRGVLYILDEPSIGLHQRDNQKLLLTMRRLRDLGNTVIVVEHDRDMILSADWVIDMGPGAGIHGGAVVAEGTPLQIMKEKKSLTGQYLSRRKEIPLPHGRRIPTGFLILKGVAEHNLKGMDVPIPLSVFCCVTGVSGSGKSTLIYDILYKGTARHLYRTSLEPGTHQGIEGLSHIDKIICVDQSPIGRTPRSNPATYTKLFDEIRALFASVPDAKIRGYKQGRFSFNKPEGRCQYCKGDGVIKIEMHFLPDVYVECEKCKGKRYNEETLQILYRDKNIANILDMTVEEALAFFQKIPFIRKKLQTLFEVGLSYMKLGQSATTLSGGEAQRMKLTLELAKRDTGKTLYILDEPTTGLHFEDIVRLLGILERLVEQGNTVIVIEHNMDVIKTADWIIDLGPEGGEMGGELVFQGPPEDLVRERKSYTGQFLMPYLWTSPPLRVLPRRMTGGFGGCKGMKR